MTVLFFLEDTRRLCSDEVALLMVLHMPVRLPWYGRPEAESPEGIIRIVICISLPDGKAGIYCKFSV